MNVKRWNCTKVSQVLFCPPPPWKIMFSAIVVTLANKKTMLHSLSVAHHINLFFCLLVWLWRQHVPQNRQKTQNTRPFYLKFQSCGLCLFDLLWPLWEFFGGEIKNSCSPQCIWIELTLSVFIKQLLFVYFFLNNFCFMSQECCVSQQ